MTTFHLKKKVIEKKFGFYGSQHMSQYPSYGEIGKSLNIRRHTVFSICKRYVMHGYQLDPRPHAKE